MNDPKPPPAGQVDKFKKAAREHGADTSVKRWNERLKKVARPHKPTGLTPSKVKKAKPAPKST